MTSGSWVVIVILAVTLLFGLGMWYAQTRAFYERIDTADLVVTAPAGDVRPLAVTDFRGIDSDSSPLRFRACFTVAEPGRLGPSQAAPYDGAEPLVAPDWFDCFDARGIGEALAAGRARAVLSQAEIARGVDRVIAAFPGGRAYAWHQLNGTLE